MTNCRRFSRVTFCYKIVSSHSDITILLRISARIAEYAPELANICGYLPLALRLAAGALSERVDLEPREYLKRLTDEQQRLEFVEASLNLSYVLLCDKLQQYWCSLAIFPSTFDLSAVAVIWQLDTDKAHDILSQLVAYNLVEWNSVTSRYHLHELTRLFVDTKLNQTMREIYRKRHAQYFVGVLESIFQLYQKGGGAIQYALGMFDAEWDNFQMGQAWAALNMQHDNEALQLCIDYPGNAGEMMYLQRHPYEYLEWFETGVTASEHNQDYLAQGSLLGNLGLTYLHLGEAQKAIVFFERGLQIAEKLENKLGKSLMLLNIAAAHLHLGRIYEGVIAYEEMQGIQDEISDSILVRGALNTLGAVHSSMGNHQEALEVYSSLLEIEQETGNLRGEGVTLMNLSNIYAHLGEEQKAFEYLDKTLNIAREIGDRILESDALGNLSLSYLACEKPQEAIKNLEIAIEINRQLNDKQGEGEKLSKLAYAYALLNEFDIAADLCRQGLQIACEIGDHATESIIHVVYGLIYYETGDFKRAFAALRMRVEYYQSIAHVNAEEYAITVSRLSLEEEANTLGRLGVQYFQSNRLDYAIGFLLQAAKILRKLHSPEKECAILGSIGEFYMSINKIRHATKYLNQGLLVAKRNNDRKFQALIACSLGLVQHRQGNLTSEGFDEIQKNLDYLRQINHPKAKTLSPVFKEMRLKDEAKSLMEEGHNYLQSKQYYRAIESFKVALAKYQDLEEQVHEMLLPLNALIGIYRGIGQVHRAIEYIEEFIEIAHQFGDYDFEAEMIELLSTIRRQTG